MSNFSLLVLTFCDVQSDAHPNVDRDLFGFYCLFRTIFSMNLSCLTEERSEQQLSFLSVLSLRSPVAALLRIKMHAALSFALELRVLFEADSM